MNTLYSSYQTYYSNMALITYFDTITTPCFICHSCYNNISYQLNSSIQNTAFQSILKKIFSDDLVDMIPYTLTEAYPFEQPTELSFFELHFW